MSRPTTNRTVDPASAAARDATGDGPAPWEDVVGQVIEHRQGMLHRARRVSTLVLDLWGDAPPPSPDPAATAAQDALSADDGTGRAAHLVVQGDHLTYRQLGEVLSLVQDADHYARALSVLPPRLRRRLAETGCLDERGEAGDRRPVR